MFQTPGRNRDAATDRNMMSETAAKPKNSSLAEPDRIGSGRSRSAGGAGIWRTGALLFASCAATSCSTTPTATPDTGAIERFEKQGYQPVRRESVRSQPLQWDEAGRSMHCEMLLPDRADRTPLVVYLPGLGEGERSGRRWTQAWAQAGYAVMSIQPLEEDEQAWSSEQARSGHFEVVARQGFSDAAMLRRLQALNGALAEVGRRAAAGDAILSKVDLSRVAVAGFDLGAYAAMIAAGERLAGTKQTSLAVPIKAAIALSPFAEGSSTAQGDRYHAIVGPVMQITGPQDTDASGLVASADLRSEPFRLMPPGDKYLLFLTSGSHELIGGADPSPRATEASDRRSSARSDRGDAPSPSRRGNKRPSTSSASGADASVDADEAVAPEPAARENLARSELLTRRSLNSASVRIVTTAFLDAYLRNDPAARSWLNARAGQWLAPTASLAIR
jgi:dienelactone hydrolase